MASGADPLPRVSPPTWRHERELFVLAAVVAVAYSAYGLFRHWHFNSSAYDLGIFDQTIWHLSRFEIPSSTVRGYSNMLGDHFFPILGVLAPLYWIAPAPEALIVAQAVLLAASIVPVWIFARRRLPRGATYAITTACALFWGMQHAMAFDFHEVAFAPLAVGVAIVALDDRRWLLFWAMAAVLIVTKEDLIPLIGGFGLLLLWRGDRRQGFAAIAVSCLALAVVIGFLIPAMNDSGEFVYRSAYADIVARPWMVPVALVTPVVKLRTTLLIFAAFLFLPLASPLAILILPLAVERFLSSNPTHWGTVFHYWAPAAPIAAMAAADGLARIARGAAKVSRSGRAPRYLVPACATGCLALSAVLPGHQPLWRVLRAEHYRSSRADEVGATVLDMIPSDAVVVAQAALVPHLSHRDRLFVLDEAAPDADFIVAAEQLDPWPIASHEAIRALVDARRRSGYTTVFDRDGWILLQRAAR